MHKFLLPIFLCLFQTAIHADTIVLEKTKKILKGSIIYSDQDWVKLRQGSNKVVLISKEDIFAIERSPNSEGYIRYTKIRKGRSALEIASKTFANPEKTKFVSLVGAVHIGDMDYYHQLQTILDEHDVVLFEGVGSTSNEDLSLWSPPTQQEKELELSGQRQTPQFYRRSKASSNLDFLTTLQTTIGQFLDLSFQKDGLNYSRSWWKPADVSMEELQSLMSQKNASPFDLLALGNNKEMEAQANQLMGSLITNFSTVLLGKPLSIAGKETFAELLAGQMALMDPTHGGTDSKKKVNKLMEVLITCRNDKVFQVTKDVMKVPDVKTIAIFYGAGHNADLEKRLVTQLGFTLHKEEWLIGWDIKDPTVKVTQQNLEDD